MSVADAINVPATPRARFRCARKRSANSISNSLIITNQLPSGHAVWGVGPVATQDEQRVVAGHPRDEVPGGVLVDGAGSEQARHGQSGADAHSLLEPERVGHHADGRRHQRGILFSIATQVQPLTTPVCAILALRWTALTAATVLGPKAPSAPTRSALCRPPTPAPLDPCLRGSPRWAISG